MKNFLLVGFLSMFAASQAQAGFISLVTGADMAGIEVTATFSDMSTETLTWEALTADSGGVSGTGWTLVQEGNTFGELTGGGIVVGAWTLINNSATLESLFINLLPANFIFDTLFGDASANGSGSGREFVSDVAIGSMFGGLLQDELYSTLTLTGIEDGQTRFLIDTDLVSVSVSAPATASILMLSLLGLVMNARRKQA